MVDLSSDDAIITTEVDKLVRVLSQKKKLELRELAKEVGLSPVETERWLHVLEEEGYVAIEYNLTKSYAVWKGMEESEQPEIKEAQPEFTVDEDDEIDLSEIDEEAPKPPEEDVDAIRRRIIEAVEESDFEQDDVEEPGKEFNIEGPAEIVDEISDEDEWISEDSPEHLDEVDKKEESQPLLEESPMPIGEKSPSLAVVDEIKLLKEEIDDLKSQRGKLYSKKVLPLESRMEADLVAYTEKLLEKEKKLAKLRESYEELPEKTEHVEKLKESLSTIEEEGVEALEIAREKLAEFMFDVEKERGELQGAVADIRESMEEGKEKVEELKEMSGQLEQKRQDAISAFETVSEELERINEFKNSLLETIEDIENSHTNLKKKMDTIEAYNESKEQKLADIEEQFTKLDEVEGFIKESVLDYEASIKDIIDYVSKSEEELEELKKSAEAHYVSKYIQELEHLSEGYSKELAGIKETDRNIDQKMKEAQARLDELMAEGKKMIKKLKKDAGEYREFESAASSAKEKAEKVKQSLEKKSSKREAVRRATGMKSIPKRKAGKTKKAAKKTAKKTAKKKPAKKPKKKPSGKKTKKPKSRKKKK
ncbi:hypothetical protein JXB01_04415 [Candidatus Micrarchaeota archaeon]|nr:hypothetical protein [Candidatus Micrarchaeota archaeon]